MQEYIDKGHAQKVPTEEQNRDDGKVWYLPHHPVIHQVKPEKTRIIFDCAVKFNGQSLNDHLLSGLDLMNSIGSASTVSPRVNCHDSRSRSNRHGRQEYVR